MTENFSNVAELNEWLGLNNVRMLALFPAFNGSVSVMYAEISEAPRQSSTSSSKYHIDGIDDVLLEIAIEKVKTYKGLKLNAIYEESSKLASVVYPQGYGADWRNLKEKILSYLHMFE